jgi:hypothetical protein
MLSPVHADALAPQAGLRAPPRSRMSHERPARRRRSPATGRTGFPVGINLDRVFDDRHGFTLTRCPATRTAPTRSVGTHRAGSNRESREGVTQRRGGSPPGRRGRPDALVRPGRLTANRTSQQVSEEHAHKQGHWNVRPPMWRRQWMSVNCTPCNPVNSIFTAGGLAKSSSAVARVSVGRLGHLARRRPRPAPA